MPFQLDGALLERDSGANQHEAEEPGGCAETTELIGLGGHDSYGYGFKAVQIA